MTGSETASIDPVGRYAPSPTGALHLGNLRTALAAYLFTRSRGGRFLLRVEDLDTPRVKPGCAERHLEDLWRLGIDWDEPPVYQSQRTAEYTRYLEVLVSLGLAYPCFCSRRDIQLALSAPHREDAVPPYPGTCRELPQEVVAQHLAGGKQHSYRLKVDGASPAFGDGFAGEVELPLDRQGGDFVIRRADGLFAYQLACALDDSLSGVTEVLRGEDLLESGARQNWVLECLGLPRPKYYHIPLMLGKEGQRLSKRAGGDDLGAFERAGLDTAGVRGYLAWTLGQAGRGERPAMKALIERFDLDAIPKENVTVRPDDLEAFARTG